jgi:hypothetical protein
MKSLHVFLTINKYKIVTMYRLDSGSYILSQPIFILNREIGNEELSKYISSALEESKQLSEKEEEKYRIGSKLLLKNLKESSFNKLYENSKSCAVYVEENRICIEPYDFKDKVSGLIVNNENIIELKSDISYLDLTKNIIEILNPNRSDLSPQR